MFEKKTINKKICIFAEAKKIFIFQIQKFLLKNK